MSCAIREQAKVIGQALVDAQWLECVTDQEQQFKDEYSLYRPGQVSMTVLFSLLIHDVLT